EEMMRRNRLGFGLAAIAAAALAVPPPPAWAAASTLQEALMLAYSSNPTLLAERANLRATDETVPAALAGWRPTVTVSANAGKITGSSDTRSFALNNIINQDRGTNSEQLSITQPLYKGGGTVAGVNKAENQVKAERAKLIAQEIQTFGTVVN